jgi:hypothetical protein
MTIISKPIKRSVILEQCNTFFQTMVKAVVDIEKGVMAIDGELHADLEALLLEEGSKQENIWGINLYLIKEPSEWIEYTALINIRPSSGNRGMEIQDPSIRNRIENIVKSLILE